MILPNKVIVISGTDARYISRKKLDKFVLIHNGCDIPEPFPPEKMLTLGIKPKEYLLFVGRLDPRKGCHYLIQALKRLETDIKLIIVGGPLESSYGRYIKRLAEDDKRIMFLGPVYDKCLNELFSNAYIYVHPSESEGQSISLLEGLAYGNCVVTSDTPESVETAGQRACYFKAGDWEDLKRELEEVIAYPSKVEEKRIEAKEHVKKNYQWNDKILEYEALYSSILLDEISEK